MSDTLEKLYNLDESRAFYVTETFTLSPETDPNGKHFLNHIPKKNTLTIHDETTGVDMIIENNHEPIRGEVWFEYRDDYDYVAAKGVVVFNPEEAEEGRTYTAHYIPVASRIDASVINGLIDAAGGFGTVWTKAELADPNNKDIIAWQTIKDRPELATTEKDGLLSKEDKARLDLFPYDATTAPITNITFTDMVGLNPIEFTVDSWSDKLTFALGKGLNVTRGTETTGTDGIISLSENGLREILGLTANISGALVGTDGEPSGDNKYVTNSDPRLTDLRDPKAHQHVINDVVGLEAALNGKAPASHEHSIDDINGVEALRGEDGVSPLIHIDATTVTGAPGTSASVVNMSGNPQNLILRFTVPRGKDGAIRWEDVDEEERRELSIRGDKGDTGMPAAVFVDGVHTGPAGSDVEIEAIGPIEKEYEGVVYSATTLNFQIPRGDKGEQGVTGMPAAALIGTVTTTNSDQEAEITAVGPEEKKIGDEWYSATTFNFKLPRGPKGTSSVDKIEFSMDNPNWSEIDEDENYTLRLTSGGGIPVTLPYEDVGSGQYEVVLATVKFNATYTWIICDHKFSGYLYFDGLPA